MNIHTLLKPARVSAAAAVLALSLYSPLYAAGQHGGGHGAASHMGGGAAIGEPGKASEVSRTIEMVMTDNRFSPEKIAVKKGQTIRFRVTNKGEFVHEFNIGTAAMHQVHRKEMVMMVEHGVIEPDRIHRDRMTMKMPGGGTMEHDDPNSVLLEPGKSAEVIWKFAADATLEFACNLPGHYESGMMGAITIR